jgi:hypothetical protein
VAGILDLFSNPASQGILNTAAGLLQASGPQMRPVSFGQALGQGFQQGTQAYQGAQQAQLEQQMADVRKRFMEAQIGAMGAPDNPVGKIDPKAYTPESLQKYSMTRNFADLVPASPVQQDDEFTRALKGAGLQPGSPQWAAAMKARADRMTALPQPAAVINMGSNGIDYGNPPKDMAWAREPNGKVKLAPEPKTGFLRPVAVPVAGGPVEQARAKEEEARTAQQRQQATYADVVTGDVDRALNLVEKSMVPVTGFGALASAVPGTPAHDLANLLNTIKSNAGFDRLQQMRASSPTGGALGNVSEMENKMLQATIGSVEQSQSKEQFVYNMKRLKDIYLDIIHGPGNRPDGQKTKQGPMDKPAAEKLSPEEEAELKALRQRFKK